MPTQLTTLIVDSSSIFRSALERSLSEEEDIRVLATRNGCASALDFIASNPPDVVLLDAELPGVLGAISRIHSFNKEHEGVSEIGVILITSRDRRTADVTIMALEAGAFDFATKPAKADMEETIRALHRQLAVKMRSFTSKRAISALSCATKNGAAVLDAKTQACIPEQEPEAPAFACISQIKAVVVGVSTGGPKALGTLLPDLTARITQPVFVVQHMPAHFTQSLAESLDAKCRYAVVEAKDNMEVRERTVYIAPGGHHMALRKFAGGVRIQTPDGPPEHGCRPSANVLFRSAAEVYGNDVVALVLTGMGSDGTLGLEKLKAGGAFVIAQDKESSVVWGMPGSAVGAGRVDKVLPLSLIPREVEALTRDK